MPTQFPARTHTHTDYAAKAKAHPVGGAGTHERVRHDRIDDNGKLTLRIHGRCTPSASDEPTPGPP
ncbi:hypothetical protein [Cellulomonas sp. URHB0016]